MNHCVLVNSTERPSGAISYTLRCDLAAVKQPPWLSPRSTSASITGCRHFDFQVTVFTFDLLASLGAKDEVLERCNAVICREEVVPLVKVPNSVVVVTDDGEIAAVKLEPQPVDRTFPRATATESMSTVVAAAFEAYEVQTSSRLLWVEVQTSRPLVRLR